MDWRAIPGRMRLIGASSSASMIRELQNPGLLYLAALLHDTGKGRAGDDHALESARMAKGVLTPAGDGCL